MMTRTEHLAWAKERALEYVDAGAPNQAYTSMASDLRKHPDLSGHPFIELGMMHLMAGRSSDMRSLIEGCN